MPETVDIKRDNFYKTGFWSAVSALIALGAAFTTFFIGQYNPNRNIVTIDELQAINARLESDNSELNKKIDGTNLKIDDTNAKLDILTGKLEGKGVIDPK